MQCLRRAAEARNRAVRSRRWGGSGSEPSSGDGLDMECEEDEDDETVMQDDVRL